MVVISNRSFDDLDFREASVDLRDVHFIGCSFRGSDFKHARLERSTFTGCNLDRASFQEATAERIRFEGCSVRYTDWTGADLTHAVGTKGFDGPQIEAGNEECEGTAADKERTAVLVGMSQPHDGSKVPEPSFRDSAFRNADLSWAVFGDCDFTGGNFQSARLHSTCLRKSKLVRAVLSDASFGWEQEFVPSCGECPHAESISLHPCNHRFEETIFDEAHARRADFENSVFRGTFFQHTDLQRAILKQCHFDGAVMSGALMSNALAEKTIFHGVNLTGAVLREIQLMGAKFLRKAAHPDKQEERRCILTGVDATGADFSAAELADILANAARFHTATLVGANLSGAVLVGAIFERADLSGANLTEANAEEADFSQAEFSKDTCLLRGRFPFAVFSGVTFPGGILMAGAAFRSTIMDGVEFGHNEGSQAPTVMDSLVFVDTNLTGAAFRPGCLLTNVDFTDANLTSASFGAPRGRASGDRATPGIDGPFITLRDCIFTDGRLERSGWVRTKVERGIFTNCAWNSSSIADSEFYGCKLSRVEFRSSDLVRAAFHGCRISSSDFSGSDFINVNILPPLDSGLGPYQKDWATIRDCKFNDAALVSCTMSGLPRECIIFRHSDFRNTALKNCTLSNIGFGMCDFSEGFMGATCDNVSHYRSRFRLASLEELTPENGFAVFLACSFEASPLPQDMGRIILYRCDLAGDGILPPHGDGEGDYAPETLPYLLDCTFTDMALPTWHVDEPETRAQTHRLRGLSDRLLILTSRAHETTRRNVIQAVIEAYGVFNRTPHMRELQNLRSAGEESFVHHFVAKLWHGLRDNFVGVGETAHVGACIKEYRYQQLLADKPRFLPLRFRWPRSDECMTRAWCAIHFCGWSSFSMAVCSFLIFLAARNNNAHYTAIPAVLLLVLLGVGYWSLRSKSRRSYLSLIVFQFGESAGLILLNAMVLIFLYAGAYWGLTDLESGKVVIPSQVSKFTGKIELAAARAAKLESSLSANGLVQASAGGFPKARDARGVGPEGKTARSASTRSGFSMTGSLRGSGRFALDDVAIRGHVTSIPEDNVRSLSYALDCLYFSAVTFSTVGYGDLRPEGALRFLAAMEALTGAFTMALFVYAFTRGTAER